MNWIIIAAVRDTWWDVVKACFIECVEMLG